MNKWNTQGLVDADKQYLWHPFTSMAEWCAAIRDVVVLMPPFCISLKQLTQAVQAIRQAICDVYAESSQPVSADASR